MKFYSIFLLFLLIIINVCKMLILNISLHIDLSFYKCRFYKIKGLNYIIYYYYYILLWNILFYNYLSISMSEKNVCFYW